MITSNQVMLWRYSHTRALFLPQKLLNANKMRFLPFSPKALSAKFFQQVILNRIVQGFPMMYEMLMIYFVWPKLRSPPLWCKEQPCKKVWMSTKLGCVEWPKKKRLHSCGSTQVMQSIFPYLYPYFFMGIWTSLLWDGIWRTGGDSQPDWLWEALSLLGLPIPRGRNTNLFQVASLCICSDCSVQVQLNYRYTWFRYTTRYTSVEREELLYHSSTMVAEMGGTLSLFLGVSFMTIWDGFVQFKKFPSLFKTWQESLHCMSAKQESLET